MVACAELARLSPTVAEVRSLVVTESLRGQKIGSRLVAHLAATGTSAGYSTLCAFTHDPSHFVRLGFTIVPHIWMPEKIAHDCTGCALFRRCGQYAVRLMLRQGLGAVPERTAAMVHGRGVAPRRLNIERLQLTPVDGRRRRRGARGGARMIAADGRSTQTIAGGVTAPAGFRAAGVACGIKANGKPDLSLLVSDGEASAAAVFTTNVAQAAPILVSREHLQQSRRPRHGRGRQQRLRQCLHRRRRHARRARDDAPRRRGGRSAVRRRCWSRRPASSASSCRWRRWRRASVRPRRRCRTTAAPTRRARIMTTDPFPKEAAAEVTVRGRTFRVGGMAKGSGMIEPMMATMLGFVTTDAGGRAGAAAARAQGGGRRHVQRHQRRRRVLDQRLRVRAGERRQRRAARRGRLSGARRRP